MSEQQSGWMYNSVPIEDIEVRDPKQRNIKIIGLNPITRRAPWGKWFFNMRPIVHVLFDGGQLAEAMVFDVALTPKEVRRLMEQS